MLLLKTVTATATDLADAAAENNDGDSNGLSLLADAAARRAVG